MTITMVHSNVLLPNGNCSNCNEKLEKKRGNGSLPKIGY